MGFILLIIGMIFVCYILARVSGKVEHAPKGSIKASINIWVGKILLFSYGFSAILLLSATMDNNRYGHIKTTILAVLLAVCIYGAYYILCLSKTQFQNWLFIGGNIFIALFSLNYLNKSSSNYESASILLFTSAILSILFFTTHQSSANNKPPLENKPSLLNQLLISQLKGEIDIGATVSANEIDSLSRPNIEFYKNNLIVFSYFFLLADIMHRSKNDINSALLKFYIETIKEIFKTKFYLNDNAAQQQFTRFYGYYVFDGETKKPKPFNALELVVTFQVLTEMLLDKKDIFKNNEDINYAFEIWSDDYWPKIYTIHKKLVFPPEQ